MRAHRHHLIIFSCLVVLFASSTLLYVFDVFGPSGHPTEQYTPVVAAAAAGDLATVRAAVDEDPSLLRVKGWENQTLLHVAVGQNHQNVTAYVLDKGADVNAVTTEGLTPLHMAAQNGNIAIITLLLEREAKIDALDVKGWSPLDRAIKWEHPDAADFLRQRGGHPGTPRG
jgi:ankyrin repeat protein